MKISKRVAILITIIFIILIFHNVDFKKLFTTFHFFNYKILIPFSLLYIIALIIRGLRWKCLIPEDKEFRISELSSVYATGATLNVLLPARAGDFYRAYFIGKKHNRNKLEIFASVFLERIFDGLTVLSILLFAMFTYNKTPFMVKLSTLAFIFFGGSLLFAYLLLRLNKTDYICEFFKNHLTKLFTNHTQKICEIMEKINLHLNFFIAGFKPLMSAKNMFLASISSITIWLIECYMIFILTNAFGLNIVFSAALFVVSFIALATIIPSTSIYIGPFQYAFVLALGMYHINKEKSLAIAFTFQTITFLILACAFIYFICKNHLNFTQIKNSSIEESNNL